MRRLDYITVTTTTAYALVDYDGTELPWNMDCETKTETYYIPKEAGE